MLGSFRSIVAELKGLPAITIALIGLLAAISLSPRFPVPIGIAARRFDLRIEDILLASLLLWWALRRRPRLRVPDRPVLIALGSYLAVAVVGTVVNIALYRLDAGRAAVYLGKQIEYFAIFLVALSWVRTARDARAIVLSFFVFAAMNAAWFGVQLAFHFNREVVRLYAPPPDFGGYSYGPGLIGEISPLSAGAYFGVAGLVLLAVAALARGRPYGLAVALLSACTVAVLHTQSRDAIGILFLGAVIVIVLSRPWRRAAAAFAIAVPVGLAMLLLTGQFVVTVERFGRLPISLLERAGIASQALQATPTVPPTPFRSVPATSTAPTITASPPLASPSPLLSPGALPTPAEPGRFVVQLVLGFGQGAPGAVAGIAGELHDHYLRLFIESGLAGLIAFLALLGIIAVRLWRQRRATEWWTRTLAIAMLAVLAGYAGAAFFEDMFLPVIPNELLWLFIGVTLALGARGQHPYHEAVAARRRT